MFPFPGMRQHYGRGYGYGHRRGGGHFGLLMIAAAIHRIGLENIPAVTLSMLGAQVACFLGLAGRLAARGALGVCLNPESVVMGLQWWRMFTHLFYHADDFHLGYNMTSFLWKGVQLERAMGTAKFLALLVSVSVATPVFHVMIAFLAHESRVLAGLGLFQECAVGFSGVCFALKVLTTFHSQQMHDVFFGMFSVQGKYVVWAELVMIHLLRPGTSFLGHLAGILAGLAYLMGYLDPVASPLEAAFDALGDVIARAGANYPPGGGGNSGGGVPPPRNYRGGHDPRADPPPPQPPGPDPNRDQHARQRAADAAARRFQTGGY